MVLEICTWEDAREAQMRDMDARDVREIEVMWMASGEIVCFVQAAPGMRVADVKAQVCTQASIPMWEQRLFSDKAELLGDSLMSTYASSNATVQLIRSVTDPRNTDVAHFTNFADLDQLLAGEFTRVRHLADAIHGTVCLYRWCRPGEIGESVVVKQMPNKTVFQNRGKESNEWQAHFDPTNAPIVEDALTEIGVLSYLSRQPDLPVYLLRMLGAFEDAVSQSTWLVTEFAEGGELFGVAAAGGVSEAQCRGYMWQMLQATGYLHSHRIGHRDVSLENVLLKNGIVRLMDFGMAVQTHSQCGEPLRYFRLAGKDTYRAPECYVPTGATVRVEAPSTSHAGDVVLALAPSGSLCQARLPADAVGPCTAEVWGYAVPPVDVFACGVCLFSLFWGVAPWKRAIPAGARYDAYFGFVYKCGDAGIEQLLRSWQKPLLAPEAMELLRGMLRPDPAGRPTVDECLANPWFAEFGTPVPHT